MGKELKIILFALAFSVIFAVNVHASMEYIYAIQPWNYSYISETYYLGVVVINNGGGGNATFANFSITTFDDNDFSDISVICPATSLIGPVSNIPNSTFFACLWNSTLENSTVVGDGLYNFMFNVSNSSTVGGANTTFEYSFNVTIDKTPPKVNILSVTNNGTISPTNNANITIRVNDSNPIFSDNYFSVLDNKTNQVVLINIVGSQTNYNYTLSRLWNATGFRLTNGTQSTELVTYEDNEFSDWYDGNSKFYRVRAYVNNTWFVYLWFNKTTLSLANITGNFSVIIPGSDNITVINTNSSYPNFPYDTLGQSVLYTQNFRLLQILLNDSHTFNLTVSAQDFAGNVGRNSTELIAGILPQYFNNSLMNFSSASYAPNNPYEFNITWKDTGILDKLIISINTSNPVPTTTNKTQLDAETYLMRFVLTDLSAGDYAYNWSANDTRNNWNVTPNYIYRVNKTAPSLNLVASPGWTVTQGTATAVTCSGPSQLSLTLYKNGQNFSSGNPVTDSGTYPIGDYYYQCNTDGNSNYTTGTATPNTLRITSSGGGGVVGVAEVVAGVELGLHQNFQ